MHKESWVDSQGDLEDSAAQLHTVHVDFRMEGRAFELPSGSKLGFNYLG